MRLITHNFLMCNRKQCQQGFPLTIKLNHQVIDKSEGTESETPQMKPAITMLDIEFVKEQIQSLIPKLEWSAFIKTISDLNPQIQDEEMQFTPLPETYQESDLEDDMFLQAVHQNLLQCNISEGELTCKDCGRVYPIVNSIPNMLLGEDEC